ncbi:sodium:solute symporter [candidate division KSB1 bacterium]|nr:MAG: sodium:solute symporter [candidate division KSB1 bacterium]MBC6947395.1 sodium:solute symporter [candidate division KSB1 bacterium]MCE7942538.1 sodium:solute symporter [Chlorobi bacterium CHB1]MDL1875934.1 sodium:solute symporter [Cytophagia bacterium CHB2]
MQLHWIDISIIIVYMAAMVMIGFMISKRATKNIDSYFLGGKTIPWYVLGISNASGMFDITGTMWLVYVTFVYGLKGVFLPWLWPVFNQVFQMIYLSLWLRRSNVMTGAEWLETRFGTGMGAKLSHISIVTFALVSVIGFMAYGFIGIGKFAASFLPWDISPNAYALIFTGITTLYVIKGGMFSVVFTELAQYVIMAVASIAIGVIAINRVSPEALQAAVPAGWKNIFFGWNLNLDWTGILDSVNAKIAADGYSLFAIFFGMMVFKGFLVSAAGPAPNYDMQRVLATKSPKEAALMSSWVSIVLFFPRYMMIAGLSVLALVFFSPQLKSMGDNLDFELILPYAIGNFVPIGLMGVLMAGLLAAFMSTFAATVNAAPAYLVNDIYKRFINPNADDKTYVRMSYLCSFAVVAIGTLFGYVIESIDSVTQWIVNALWGGYTAANVLKWYWWRFNGYGYFWGMVTGILASLITPMVVDISPVIYQFPIIFAVSLLGCIAATFATKSDDMEVLKRFYKQVHPWGFWKPVHDLVIAEDPHFKANKAFKRDMFNIVIGIIWQTSLVALPIYLVIQEKMSVVYALIVIAITSFILKKNWYDKLEDEPEAVPRKA